MLPLRTRKNQCGIYCRHCWNKMSPRRTRAIKKQKMILAVEFIVCDVYRAKIYIFFDKTKVDKGHWNKKIPGCLSTTGDYYL